MFLAVGLMTGTAMAIDVPDASFEDDQLDPDNWAYVDDMTTPWANTYYSGYAWVGNTYYYGDWYPGVGHTGDQYVDINASYLHQSLGATYVEGETYELSIWCTTDTEGQGLYFYFTDGTGNDGWTGASILEDSGLIEVAVENNLQTWSQYSHQYTATAADAGKDIGICIYGRSVTYGDDVALTIIPEPITLSLLGLGGLVLIRRKK